MLRNQFITNSLGRILNELNLEHEKNEYINKLGNKLHIDNISTNGYKSLLNIIKNTCNDSQDLFNGLYSYNKNGEKILNNFLDSFYKIKRNLDIDRLYSDTANAISISQTSLTARNVREYSNFLKQDGNNKEILKFHIGEFSNLDTEYLNNIAIEVLNKEKIYIRIEVLMS